jgi:hypothetical protein
VQHDRHDHHRGHLYRNCTSTVIVATDEVAPLVNVRVTADGTQFVPFIRREVPRDVGYINTVYLNSHTSAQVVNTAAPVSTTTFSLVGTFVGVRIDRTDAPLILTWFDTGKP